MKSGLEPEMLRLCGEEVIRVPRFVALFSAMLIFGFQNCAYKAPSQPQYDTLPGYLVERPIGKAADYSRVTYDAHLELPYEPGRTTLSSPKRLEIDVLSGRLNLSDRRLSTNKTCSLEPERLAGLREILTNSEICELAPLNGDGTWVSCMAISLADIELSNDAANLKLRKEICASGVFLCSGMDEKLRSFLNLLRDQPPAACL